jgi:hypothetical protein
MSGKLVDERRSLVAQALRGQAEGCRLLGSRLSGSSHRPATTADRSAGWPERIAPMGYPPPEQPQGQQPQSQQPPYPYGYQPPPYPYWQQPQWRPPPYIDPKVLKPSRLWYWVAPIPALIGLVLCAVFVVQFVDRFDTNLTHLRTPGTVQLTLDAGDERGIYVQTAGALGAQSVSAGDLRCSVREAASERSVELHDASGFTLTLNNDEYVERLRFKAPRAGRYAVTCSEPPGVPLAVGKHLALREFALPAIGAIASFLIGAALTTAIAVVVAVKRSRHKQRLQREAVSGAPPGPSPPAGSAPR